MNDDANPIGRWKNEAALPGVNRMLNGYAPASMISELVPIGIYASAYGVSIQTIRRWDRRGFVQATRTPTGYRMFDLSIPPCPYRKTRPRSKDATKREFVAKGLREQGFSLQAIAKEMGITKMGVWGILKRTGMK